MFYVEVMAPAPKRLGMPLGVSRGAKMLQQLGVKPPHVPAPAVVQHTKPGMLRRISDA